MSNYQEALNELEELKCVPTAKKEWLVTHCLPFTTPKILILIGRFYEGQANKNVS